jgi:hypothetical protein
LIQKNKLVQLLMLAVLLVTSFVTGVAQSNYGVIRGIVADSQGAPIAGATVVLTSEAKKIARTTVTNGSGEYVFNAVEPDIYTVDVTSANFKKSSQSGLIVETGNALTVDTKLTVGSTSETIEVTASEPLVDNGTSYSGQLIDSQKLQNLPNPGRNPFLFSKLDNAVTPVGDPRFVRFQDQSGSSTISIAGGPLSSNNYSIDGIPITDMSNRAVIIPSIEAVDEVKLQANTYDAEIGRTSGGMFNTTLHSGAARLHGVLQGETRQTNWGANLYFNNRTPSTVNGVLQPTTARGAAEFYSYVGSLSGPIPLPHFLGGPNKTFFAMTEEGYRQRSPLTAANAFAVPTILQRGTGTTAGGNFSEIGTVNPTSGACATGRCVYDPLTGKPFPGNIIPASRINPVGQALVNAYPLPNNATTSYGGFNFNGGDTLGDRADEFNGKLTHEFGSRWLADFYYLHYGSKEPGGNALTTAPGSSSSYLLYRKVDAIGIQNTVTINPTTVGTIGFGFNRFPNDTQDISKGFNQATLGFPSNYVAALSKTGFPAITTDSGLSNEGTSNSGPAVYFSRNFVVGLAKSLGKHSVKTGYVFRAISLSFTSLSTTSGTFAFDSTLTAAPAASVPTGTTAGATAADMLLGYPTSGSLVIPAPLAITTAYQAAYLQDDYRVTQKLTLNLGFRYEYEPGVHERNNHYAVGFDRNVTYSAFGSGVQATGGVEFAGQNSYPTTTGVTGSKFSPRAGFAYAIDSKTVVKGGAGVFYIPIVYSGSASLAPGYVLTNSFSQSSATISLSNPFPTLKTQATGNSNGLSTNIGTSLTLIDQNRRGPLYDSYSLAVEHEFPMGIAFKAGYVGGHGRNLINSLNINQLPDSKYALGLVATSTGASSLTDVKSNPQVNKYAGLGAFSTSAVALYQTLLPFPQYQGISESVSDGRSDYNSLDLKVQKRFSRGMTILGAYTWSSNWDNQWGASSTLNPGNNGPQDIYNLAPEYSRSINNLPNRFTVAGTYELPFGRGKQFMSGASKWLDLAVGGWRFNDVMIMQSGGPMAITQSNSNSSLGNGAMRPTIVPGANPCKSSRPEDRLTSYFNAAAFTQTAQFGYGNQPRTSNCYGPGYVNSDLSLNKNFNITEKIHAEFRAEALNAFNTPEFNGPALNISTPASAGQITGTLGFPRLVQLGGRLTF